MKLKQQLNAIKRMFLDTAPVVYYVEENPRYLAWVEVIFSKLDAGHFEAVTSPITLAECLVIPYRNANIKLQQAFIDLITNGSHTRFISIDRSIGAQAAQLRGHYNIRLADALQFAVALDSGCDAFLTNDIALKRVTELNVVVLDEMLNL